MPTVNSGPSPTDVYAQALAAEKADTAGLSILALGLYLAEVRSIYEEFDDDLEAAPGSWSRDLLRERRDDLCYLISTLTAQTIADAAVQSAVIAEMATWITQTDPEGAEAIGASIEKMAVGILPLLAEEAGLGLARMRWINPVAGSRYRSLDGTSAWNMN